MAKLVALYKKPSDAAHFDKYYFGTHVPIAKKIGGIRHYEVSRGPIATPQGPSPYHLVAFLEFDSVEAIQRAFASPEGQAASADLGNFATGGVDLLIMDSRTL